MINDTENPYRSPSPIDGRKVDNTAGAPSVNVLLMVAWPVVFGLNLTVPILLAWSMTRDHGRSGMFVAAAVFLLGGWYLCLRCQTTARKLIAGSAITALSQLFPIVQIVAGIIAFSVAASFGLVAEGNDETVDHISSELGGFLVTLIVGCVLVIGAGIIGWSVAFLLPARWIDPESLDNPSLEP